MAKCRQTGQAYDQRQQLPAALWQGKPAWRWQTPSGLTHGPNPTTAYFKHRINSEPIKAFNNQIARLIRRSCDLRDLDYLFLELRAQSLQQNRLRARELRLKNRRPLS
jgi:hypothetical protein